MSIQFTFLGTCAADFSPRLKTDCKDRFDMDARRASCAIFNEKYMIDCGPHALESIRIAGVDMTKITDIFMTHLHSDHFNPDNVQTIASAKAEPLRLWVSEGAIVPPLENVDVRYMPKRQPLSVGSGLTVTGLEANHDANVYPQFLLFELDGKKLLYATDGAWFVHEAYKYLRNAALDVYIADATCGDYVGDFRMAEHNSIPMIRMMLPSLRTFGIVNDKTQIYLTHIAPSLHKPHAETVEIAAADGMKVAYDGLRFEV